MSISIFLFRYTICMDFIFNRRDFWHLIKFCENFSLGSSLNQSRSYQGNPCGVYPDLSSLPGSGFIQNSVTCIKQSAPSKDHIIQYQSFGSCYRFYPIQFLFFSLCKFSQVHVLFCYLRSCLCLVVFLLCSCSCSCFFQILCKKKFKLLQTNSVTNSVWGKFGLLEEFWGFRV